MKLLIAGRSPGMRNVELTKSVSIDRCYLCGHKMRSQSRGLNQ